MSFDGTDDYVDCGNDSSLDITDAITIEAWARLSSSADSVNKDIVHKLSQGGYRFIGTAGVMQFFIYNGSTWRHYSSAIYSDTRGNWHLFIVVYNGVSGSFYLDGNNGGSISGENITHGLDIPLRVGYKNGLGGGWYDGFIDEVRIYNRALSEEEIKLHYAAGR